jgi:branched-chain amino acid transport system permease protein
VLAMVIIGGLGSIWGAVVGGLLLGYINNWLIPDVLNGLPGKLGLNFPLTEIEFGIFGFLLVLVMVLRPQGLIPERRRRLELTSEIAAEDAQLVETTNP